MENNLEKKIKKISFLISGISLSVFIFFIFLTAINIRISNLLIANTLFILLLSLFVIGIILFFSRKLISNKLPEIVNDRKITKKYLLVFFSCLFILFLLYWFQLRPNEIRKSCAEEATTKYRGYASRIANNYYRLCLVKHMMKPESLFVK